MSVGLIIMNAETLSYLGNFIGGVAVVLSLIFLAYEMRASNKLARAQNQREMRLFWQDTLFKMGEWAPEFQEALVNFPQMPSEKQLKAVNVLASMGNQVDTPIKLHHDGVETDDNVQWMLDAFVGFINTPGGIVVWKHLEEGDFFGEDLIRRVRRELDNASPPNLGIIEALPWF
jgi:hypothetical protein